MKPIVFERLVTAYDGSVEAAAALRFGVDVAGRCGARLAAAYAVPRVRGPVEDVPDEESVPQTKDEAERWLESTCAAAFPGGDMDTVVLESARPATAVIEYAEDIGADLILAGRSGHGRLSRFLIGTIAERLIAYAPCSTAVFPGAYVPASRPVVLVGHDGSEPSSNAVQVASRLAAILGAELRIVHVVDPHIPFAGQPTEAVRRALREYGDEVLHEPPRTVRAPLDLVTTEHREGDPRAELLAAASEQHPSMMVVGHRGSGGFAELVLGSTARDVAQRAVCPTLVARPG